MKKYQPAVDYKKQIINDILTGPNKKHWKKVLDWFEKYTPEDDGVMYMHETFFTDEHMQSIANYYEMLKYINFLYRSFHHKDFEYEYSAKRINNIKLWFANMYVLSRGSFAGKPFNLMPFQVWLLFMMFAFTKKESKLIKAERDKGIVFMTDTLYYNTVRKQGKSEFFAGLGVFLQQNPFGNDNLPEIYASGPKDDISKIIYEKAQVLVKSTEDLLGLYEKVNTRTFRTHARGTFKSLPFTKESIEGKEPSLGIITEYHLAPSDIVVESFESAKAISRLNAFIVYDTTKGNGIFGVAHTREMLYKKNTIEQLDNPLEMLADDVAGAFWEIDENDNFDLIESTWPTNILRKSNPMLGILTDLTKLQKEWRKVKHDPLKRREFIVKKVGKWLSNSETVVELEHLVNCDKKYNEVENFQLKHLEESKAECVIGIDLASSKDTNALVMVFKGENENGEIIPIVHAKTVIPKDTLDERVAKERKPYYDWEQAGYIKLSGKTTVDFKDIAEIISNWLKRFNVKYITYDPYLWHHVKTYLIDQHRFDESLFVKVKQGAAELSAPLEDLIRKIANLNFYPMNNKVVYDQLMNWKPDLSKAGGMYFRKQKQSTRIDILAALVTALTKIDEISFVGEKPKLLMESWHFD